MAQVNCHIEPGPARVDTVEALRPDGLPEARTRSSLASGPGHDGAPLRRRVATQGIAPCRSRVPALAGWSPGAASPKCRVSRVRSEDDRLRILGDGGGG